MSSEQSNRSGPESYLDVQYASNRVRSSSYPVFLRCKIARIIGGAPQRVIDVGAGSGDFLRAWSDCSKTTALDREFKDIRGVSKKIVVQSFENLNPAYVGRYDLVFCKSVIEHMGDPFALVRELLAITKAGGHAVVMTPDFRYYARVFYDDPTHVRPFDLDGLCDLVRMCGGEIVYRGLEHQHAGLDSSKLQRFAARIVGVFLSEVTACSLSDRLKWPWLRWAVLRTAMVVCRPSQKI
jgi:2-polyprenyl-3-methyl-5-hydroxy-6-metoxy-1,4-benzoquinol methylase